MHGSFSKIASLHDRRPCVQRTSGEKASAADERFYDIATSL